jgi:hypothetical protein
MAERYDGGYDGRARQPRIYGPEEGRRGQPARPQGRQQARRDYPARVDQPRMGRRSRFLAVVVLVATALVILITGLAVGGGEGSSGSEPLPFELLPFPGGAVTSTTQ